MRFGVNGGGGVQPVKVSRTWVGREREDAVEAMGTRGCQF